MTLDPGELTGDQALRFEAIAAYVDHALHGRCPPDQAGRAIALHLQALGYTHAGRPRIPKPKNRRRRPRKDRAR